MNTPQYMYNLLSIIKYIYRPKSDTVGILTNISTLSQVGLLGSLNNTATKIKTMKHMLSLTVYCECVWLDCVVPEQQNKYAEMCRI